MEAAFLTQDFFGVVCPSHVTPKANVISINGLGPIQKHPTLDNLDE